MVENPHHKESEKAYMCFKTRRASTLDYTVSELDFLKIEFEILCLMNLIFTACVACKNCVQSRTKINFIKLEISNSIFQKSSADR